VRESYDPNSRVKIVSGGGEVADVQEPDATNLDASPRPIFSVVNRPAPDRNDDGTSVRRADASHAGGGGYSGGCERECAQREEEEEL
jgi:hypothetical protein